MWGAQELEEGPSELYVPAGPIQFVALGAPFHERGFYLEADGSSQFLRATFPLRPPIEIGG